MHSEQLDRSVFLKELKQIFPMLKPELNKEMGLLHFEMTVFRNFAQQMINDGETDTVEQCFSIALKYYLNGNAKLKDAVIISFIEDLEFTDTPKRSREWAWNLFPEQLKDEFTAFHKQG